MTPLNIFGFNILAALNPTPGFRYFIFLLLPVVLSILYLSWCWLEKNSKIKHLEFSYPTGAGIQRLGC